MIVCRVDDVPVGEGRAFTFEGRRLALFHTPGGWHAIADGCPHAGGPLSDGIATDCSVTCPLHERRFSLLTGEALGHIGPGVDVFEVRVKRGEVHVSEHTKEIAA